MAPSRRLALALGLAAATLPAQAKEREPDGKATGKVYEWKSKDGLAYQYYLPKSFDPDQPINLTFILHGSNLDRRWGFANHKAGDFRADDFVVSPDGTTSNGGTGFNFLQGKDDLERLHALHEELKERFKIRATYLYGHSQGSFFSLFYAGAYPDDVQGVVAHASGVWIGTQATKKHHHQAVVLMHGTKDATVPYSQSVGGIMMYEDAKYPHARLRSLDDWNHWPAPAHTEQQLAWCEGMTTDDPTRMQAALTTLAEVKQGADPVALYQVAARVAASDATDDAAKKVAQQAMQDVEACAASHVKAIGKGGKKLDGKPWVGHVPLFLRHFRGVPACDEFEKAWGKRLDKQKDTAKKHARAFWQKRDSKEKDAFVSGLALVQDAYLTETASNEKILSQLEEWGNSGKAFGLSKKNIKDYKRVLPAMRKSLDKGKKSFDKVSKRFR